MCESFTQQSELLGSSGMEVCIVTIARVSLHSVLHTIITYRRLFVCSAKLGLLIGDI